MQIKLPPDMKAFVDGRVAAGGYGSAAEVVLDAVRRMQADEVRRAAWREAIRQGDDEIDRGEGLAYTAKTLNDITEAAIAGLNGGQPLNPDVCP